MRIESWSFTIPSVDININLVYTLREYKMQLPGYAINL